MEPKVDSYMLKLSGKCELPEAIENCTNYDVLLKGSVISVADADNHDGTVNRVYTFKPITGEILRNNGESLKLKDTRSISQLMRSLIYKKWVNAASSLTFDEYYERMGYGIMRDMDELIDRYTD